MAAAAVRGPLKALCFFALAFNGLMLYWLGGALISMLKPSDATDDPKGVVVPTVLLDSAEDAAEGASPQAEPKLAN